MDRGELEMKPLWNAVRTMSGFAKMPYMILQSIDYVDVRTLM